MTKAFAISTAPESLSTEAQQSLSLVCPQSVEIYDFYRLPF